MEVVIFHPRHLEVAELREHEREILKGVGNAKARLESLMNNSKAAGTFLKDGRVITCAGFVELWPGVAELWQLPTVYITRCVVDYARTLKQYMENVVKTFHYHRLQTTCPADDLHDRWMQFLGFEKEGLLKKYTFSQQDYSIFGRVYGS